MIHFLKNAKRSWQTFTPIEKFIVGAGVGALLGDLAARIEQRQQQRIIEEGLARVHKIERVC